MQNPELITTPFASKDKIHTIPVSSTVATVVTQEDGWRQDPYSKPLESGGKAPERIDFNSIFNWITTHLFFNQKGWLWNYDAKQNYYHPAIVWDGNEMYFCKQDVEVGNTFHRPSADISQTYWVTLPEYIRRIIINNSKLTIRYDNQDLGSFTTNQSGDKIITVPTANNAKLTIKYTGSVVGEFTANAKEDKVIELHGDVIPVGTVQAYAGSTTPPAGWLLCDGTAKSRTTYKALFDVIGTRYGAGDGSTTFNIPNLIDRFIEGTNTNSGSYIEAGLPNITGRFWGGGLFGYASEAHGEGCFRPDPNSYTVGCKYNDDSRGIKFDASLSDSTYGRSNTVQPKAVFMRYIIKF